MPRKRKELEGKKFNKLTVLVWMELPGQARWGYRCRCSCGGYTYARSNDLTSGRIKSCGCLRSEWQYKDGSEKGKED